MDEAACVLSLMARREHLLATELMLLRDGLELPLPVLSLTRSIHESLLNVCWLIDTEVATEQRVARLGAGHGSHL